MNAVKPANDTKVKAQELQEASTLRNPVHYRSGRANGNKNGD
ncbi:hypothetical protein GCM10008018_56200 [Paenibacillus marchantiophytorum]|uniref:Small acid-soluble spore protein P n=1 Tax=Paenibacillus marchantiophytorum TaxID=1619310 RepID=A0ABQ1F8G2_9BACL|nr:hypothetical protein [Paenibacillus marchantiophytorum]GGA02896.1 hypothetical protein GCM10008018_56200 [Paenibacillus marchantiophytorum]